MRLEILNESCYEDYDRFLRSQEHSLFYHSVKYKNFLEDLLGCESHYLLAYEDDKIVAALPLMVKDGPLGRIVNSLPYYGSNGGIIGDIHCQEIIELFKKELSLMGYSSLTIVSSPYKNNLSSLLDSVTDQRFSQITPLDLSVKDYEKYIFSIIDGSARRNIKKAMALGIQVVVQNQNALPFLEKTHIENMAIIGGKAKSPDFFSKINKYFQVDKDYKIYVAELDDIPVAALLVFFYNKTVEYFTPVVNSAYREKQPLAAILFESIKDAMFLGYHHWNWGGTWLTQEGVYQFKKKWGAVDKIYDYTTHITNPALLDTDRELLTNLYEGFYIYNFNKALTDEKK